jgi:hypothetical protein
MSTEPQDWQPAEDLRYRLVFYKRDFKPLFGYGCRSIEKKVSAGEFPEPDYYEGLRAVWTRETVLGYVQAKAKASTGRRAFGRAA